MNDSLEPSPLFFRDALTVVSNQVYQGTGVLKELEQQGLLEGSFRKRQDLAIMAELLAASAWKGIDDPLLEELKDWLDWMDQHMKEWWLRMNVQLSSLEIERKPIKETDDDVGKAIT